MSRCTASEVARLLPRVSAQRREQALRYKHVFGQYCCLRSWELLEELMNDANGANDDWVYNEHGKPFLKSRVKSQESREGERFFSISHCKEAIAVVVADEPVGIDIEGIRHASDELIEQVMNEEEKERVKSQKSRVERDRAFTRLWTQKEAVLKAQGTGIQSFEQLKDVLKQSAFSVQTIEKEKYIYSIAYGKLHCLGTEIPSTDI